MLSRELEVSLNLAFKDARAKRHEMMTVEHLLLSLLDNTAAVTVLKACNANLEKLRAELETFISDTTPLIPSDQDDRETQPTLGFQRVLQRAVFHVQSSGKKEVTGAHLLVALFAEGESHAVYLLRDQDIERIDVVNYISHGVRKDGQEELLLPVLSHAMGNVINDINPFDVLVSKQVDSMAFPFCEKRYQ